MEVIVDSQQTLKDIKKEWEEYKNFLKIKYPSDEGDEWKFTCPHHRKLDEIIGEIDV